MPEVVETWALDIWAGLEIPDGKQPMEACPLATAASNQPTKKLHGRKAKDTCRKKHLSQLGYFLGRRTPANVATH